MRLHRLACLLLLALPLLGCTDDAPRLAWQDHAVIGGQPTPAGKHPAVGALVLDFAGPFCTGTLIRPDVVLTAAHCLVSFEDTSAMGFTLVNDATPALIDSVRVRRAVAHEGFDIEPFPGGALTQVNDIGLVFLEEPITGVTPVALPTVAEAAALVPGFAIAIVGYGTTDVNGKISGGVKFDALTELVQVAPFEIQLSKLGQPQNCYGDSGGPALAMLAGGERVVGVVSRGASEEDHEACDVGGIDTRVDAYLGWIEQHIADPDAPDAGPPAPDAAAPDAGAPDAGAPPPAEGEGGCGCRAAPRRGSLPAGGLLVALAALVVLRRRRR